MGRPAKKKGDIESAALALFARHGLANVSIKEISVAAGVTEGALYRHYVSKNALAKALFIREVEQFSSGLTEAMCLDATWQARLREAVRFIYDYYRTNQIGYAFMILNYHDFREEDIVGKEHNPSDIVIQGLGSMLGGDANRLVLRAAMLMGAVSQPIIMHYYGRLPIWPSAYADEVGDLVVKMLESAPTIKEKKR